MNKRLKYMALATAVMVTAGAGAQSVGQNKNDLNKEITLEREFDPVKKKVVKKTVLPKEIKKSDKEAVAPQFSDWTVPAIVPVDIPTMLPYGYRTLHNFSNQRGYLNVGAGIYLNTVVSAGYRAIEKEEEQLGVWLQHNSTWLGKNTTKLIEQPSQRQKQRFNDNLLGAAWSKNLGRGVLGVDGKLHFDSYNFYGGFGDFLKDHKTAFFEARVNGKWQSEYNLNDDDAIEYEANATLDYSGYDKSHIEGIDGAKEFWASASIEGEYNLEKIGNVGLLFGGDIANLRRHNQFTNATTDKTYGILTLAPYYKYSNDIFNAKAGIKAQFSFNDGTAVRLSPDVDLNFKIVKGVSLFANASGGKFINHLGDMHDANRYNDPLAMYANTYIPFAGKVGFNVGPFVGFTARAFVGYGFITNCLDAVIPAAHSGIYKDMYLEEDPTPDGPSPYYDENQYAAIIYMMTKCKGAYMGFDLGYKYRTLAEAKMSLVHSFASDDDYREGVRYTGYPLGDDGPTTIFNLDVTAWPIKPLMVSAGISCRLNRSAFTRHWVSPLIDDDGTVLDPGNYYVIGSLDMKDAVDLHVMARYSFSHVFSVWAQANNLLCKQWDVMPGMGAQKLGLMGGISLNF